MLLWSYQCSAQEPPSLSTFCDAPRCDGVVDVQYLSEKGLVDKEAATRAWRQRGPELLLPGWCCSSLSRYPWDGIIPLCHQGGRSPAVRERCPLQVKLVGKQNKKNLTRAPSFTHNPKWLLNFIYMCLYLIAEGLASPNTDFYFLTPLFFNRKLSWKVSQPKHPF